MSAHNPRPRVLVIEDDVELADSLKFNLEQAGYDAETVANAQEGMACANSGDFDVIITDFQMPGATGLDLLGTLRPEMPYLPIILITGHHKTETAIEATRLGAFDYVLKPILDWEAFLALVGKAAASRALAAKHAGPQARKNEERAIIGRSSPMQEVFKAIGRVAARPVTVLIRGETGTGKELVARALHQYGGRDDKPFVIVNCAAIPNPLLESELFGHEQGSFTGAESKRMGKFEQADHGTIFLDEIGDMSPDTQAKLLRVLADKTIQRVGGRDPIQVDVRVLAATHCDLEAGVRSKKFREDLYYRLNDAVIHLPPLRERREDIPDLVRYFLSQHSAGRVGPAITPEAMRVLEYRAWPGNVRELRNAVHRALLQAQGHMIEPEHVRQAVGGPSLDSTQSGEYLPAYITDLLDRAERMPEIKAAPELDLWVQREFYSQAYQLAQGDQTKVAKWLGVSRPTVREKLISFGLKPLVPPTNQS
ncbi:MAG: Fis family transcriptional regulator [Verrucomicrobia bacterium]|nr:MAG: Fis family transcriptional regulator [Verrucomicrobiota bacterium]